MGHDEGEKERETRCLTWAFLVLSALQQVTGPVSAHDVTLSVKHDKLDAA